MRKNSEGMAGAKQDSDTGQQIALREVVSEEKPERCNFPGPRGARSPLRVAIDRSAHAELIAHAKVSLDSEICGVLAGRVCEDDEGLFVHVRATIRGTAASQGSTHVTFTHATWTAIHETLESDYPQSRIVGWYHSHPGFGVEFSEMDLFIQRNFFSGPTQIALVLDPLKGTVAICYNTPRGIEYLPRFWVDGREQDCKTPAVPVGSKESAAMISTLPDEAFRKLHELDSRLGQLVLAVDEQRATLHRFLLFAGITFCLATLAVAGYAIYLQMKSRVELPRNISFSPVPVKLGEHTLLLGVQVVSWQIPPELDVVQQLVEQLKREIEEQAAKAAATNAPGTGTNTPRISKPQEPSPSK